MLSNVEPINMRDTGPPFVNIARAVVEMRKNQSSKKLPSLNIARAAMLKSQSFKSPPIVNIARAVMENQMMKSLSSKELPSLNIPRAAMLKSQSLETPPVVNTTMAVTLMTKFRLFAAVPFASAAKAVVVTMRRHRVAHLPFQRQTE